MNFVITATHQILGAVLAQASAPPVAPTAVGTLIVAAIGCICTVASFVLGQRKQRRDERRLSQTQREATEAEVRAANRKIDDEIAKWMLFRMRMRETPEHSAFLDSFDREWETNKGLRELLNRY